jgi:riboflavin synthase
MFTGIVEDLGEVESVEHHGDYARIHVRSPAVASGASPGDSVAVSGVCLTVTGLLPGTRHAGPPPDRGIPGGGTPDGQPRGFAADIMGETLRLTSLRDITPGTRVNLERPVRPDGRLGGHIVQGHVDGTGIIVSRARSGHWDVVRVSLPPGLARYVVRKGSVAVDGISLTVSAVSPESAAAPWFEVSLIPETLKRTTLGEKQPGEAVNLEVDVIAKYVEKLLGGNR